MVDNTKTEKIKLEYDLIKTEYNNLLIATTTLPLGLSGLVYSLTKNIPLCLVCFIISILILYSEATNKLDKTKSKIKELS